MLTNYHTHTTYCDGDNTIEEIVAYAIENGFASLGFSGHGYTPYDHGYCMKDTDGYIEKISQLKKKYENKIQIYCGIEEDSFSYVDRKRFDYILGSSHYYKVDGKYYPIDSDYDCFKKCLEVFSYDAVKMAEEYFGAFVNYIEKRKPDIVGHFDLITKFDELDNQYFLNNPKYIEVAEKYMERAADIDVIFEVNTGAISRGFRKSPYPAENLLYILKKKGAKILLSSDSHNVNTLNFYFDETKDILRDVGFDYVYELDNGKFVKRTMRQ